MLSIIIINHNQKEYLTTCLHSLYKYAVSGQAEVIVINNGKDDLTDTMKWFPKTKFINSENKGFSHANNLGVKYSTGSILLFLNADTELSENFSLDFLKKAELQDFAILGVKLVYPDKSFQCSFGYFPNIVNEWQNKRNEKAFKTKKLNYIKKLEEKYSQTRIVNWVTGAVMFVRRDIFEKAGGFDERYFLFYEDIDLCKRVSELGGKVVYHPDIYIIHHKGELIRNNFRDELYKYSKESQRLYYKLHNNKIQNILLNLYLSLKSLFKK